MPFHVAPPIELVVYERNFFSPRRIGSRNVSPPRIYHTLALIPTVWRFDPCPTPADERPPPPLFVDSFMRPFGMPLNDL